MSIAVVCSKCAAKLNAPDGAAGKKVKCPKCQTSLVVPDAVASQFEVVEDEPPAVKRPAGKPARVKAAADDDDDDRPRRKRGSEEGDEDDDDRPRKKKRKKGGDEEGGVSMTRNIVMGVILIILLAVAGYIFYERSKEKDEKSASNTNPNTTETPPGTLPLPKGGPSPVGAGGGDPGKLEIWAPDPDLVRELTQKGTAAGYQISLPQRYTPVETPVTLPPHIQQGAWMAKIESGESAAIVSVAAFSDSESINSARKNMRQFLVNYSAGFTDAAGIKIDSRGPTESGVLDNMEFSRFLFTAMAPNQTAAQGVVYGAVDNGRVVAAVGMGFGGSANAEIKLLETVIATLKKD